MLIVSAIVFNTYAGTFSLTESEKSQILNEAENWIDDMPEGIQDRLTDAVSHALYGFNSEIEYFRHYNDTTGLRNYPVKITPIKLNDECDLGIRFYEPKDSVESSLPLLIYFHGGGWSLGSLDTSERFCRALASEGNVKVMSVDYPLAPENPYPSAINKSRTAINIISRNAQEWGIDKNLISLGGDGAGGNLALQIYNSLPEEIKIRSMVLFYPIINSEGEIDSESKRTFGRGYGLDNRLLAIFKDAYKGKKMDKVRNLPPVLLISAGRDIIINEEKEFISSNPAVEYIEFEGAVHGFITDGHQNTSFKKAVEFTDIFLSEKDQ